MCTNFSLFLAAALVIAVVPGPGIFYVAARTLSDGRGAGFASTAGNTEIPEAVAWAKLKALGEGARIASQRLWAR